MAETKTPLRALTDEHGDPEYVIGQEHTFFDVIRHLISEGAGLSDFTVCWEDEQKRIRALSSAVLTS